MMRPLLMASLACYMCVLAGVCWAQDGSQAATAPAQRALGPAGTTAPGGDYYPGAQEQIVDDGFAHDGYAGMGYDSFGNGVCGPCGFGLPNGVWSRVEYLVWGTKGMSVPALVTTSPPTTDRENAGVLGEDGTEILFGTGTINSRARSGGRLVLGTWIDGCQQLGVEGDYFALHDLDRNFRQSSGGATILARPFFDVLQGTDSASLVAFPNLIQGRVDVDAVTRFQGAGLRAIINVHRGQRSGMGWFTGCPVETDVRQDLVVGYRFLRLDDELTITEQETSLDSTTPGSFFIQDRFRSENQFHGMDLGTITHFQRGCWSFDLLSKLAFGNVRSVARIDGGSVISDDGDAEASVGGLLAQRSNIGEYRNDAFAMAPELGFTVGYQVNPCWRMTAGYTFLYWSRVFRAGDQIDLDVNPDLLPPEEDEVTEGLRPRFPGFASDDFWAQGLTLGLEGTW